MSRRRIRKSRPLTPTERQRRWRAKNKKSKRRKSLTDAQQKRRWRATQKQKTKIRKEVERQAKRGDVTGPLNILRLAITDVSDAELASNSVDAIITDPPYALAAVPLYGELAHFATRVLKPSGWCLAMIGDLYLGRITQLMTEAGLLERGLITVIFPGGHHSRIATTKTFQAAKTILLFQKPPARQPPGWGPNLIVTAAKNGHDKSLHRWQQNQAAFEKLVEHFTGPGDLVADPFAGSGTTLRAALSLGRLAWGADVDAAAQRRGGSMPPV